MKILHLDFGKNAPNYGIIGAFPFLLRWAFLFSDDLNLIGNSVTHILAKKMFAELNMNQKIAIVSKLNYDGDGMDYVISTYKRVEKETAALKHPTREILAAKMRIDNTVKRIIGNTLNEIADIYEGYGVTFFEELIDIENFHLLHNKTKLNKHSFSLWSIIDLLALDHPNSISIDSIWNLHPFFYSMSIMGKAALMEADWTGTQAEGPYMVKILDLPNLNHLGAEQLCSVKDNIAETMASFLSDLDAWAARCYAGSGSRAFLQDRILPMRTAIQSALSSDLVIKHISTSFNESVNKRSLWIGEIDPEQLLRYFNEAELLEETDSLKIRESWQKRPQGFRFPVATVWEQGKPFVLDQYSDSADHPIMGKNVLDAIRAENQDHEGTVRSTRKKIDLED